MKGQIMPSDRTLSADELRRISPGMPIYDTAGEEVGKVSEYGVQEPHLIMHKGRVFHRDVNVPLRDVQRVEATGVYLSLTRKEVHRLVDLGSWSMLGDVDLNTGMPADAPHSAADLYTTASFPDGNNVAGMTTAHGPREADAPGHDAEQPAP
jgi:hypothetical protein